MTTKKFTIGLAALVLAVGMVIAPMAASASILDGNDNLGQLFVLDRLFNGADNKTANLGNIFILDQLFNSDGAVGDGDIVSGNSNLGELFILSRLFGDGETADLGDIFILDQLFGGGDSLFGSDSIL